MFLVSLCAASGGGESAATAVSDGGTLARLFRSALANRVLRIFPNNRALPLYLTEPNPIDRLAPRTSPERTKPLLPRSKDTPGPLI